MVNIQEDAVLRSFPNNMLSSLCKKHIYIFWVIEAAYAKYELILNCAIPVVFCN